MPESDTSKSGKTMEANPARSAAVGLINPDQADRIEAATLARVTGSPHRRIPLAAEALGYAGAVIAIVAAGVTVRQVGTRIPPGAQLAFAAVTAAALMVAGSVLRAAAEPAFARLRSVLWLASTAATASFVAVLTTRFLHLHGTSVVLLAAGAWTACAVPLWWRSRSALQHLALFAGIAALAETGLERLDRGVPFWAFGVVLWILSVLWGIAVNREYLRPHAAGLFASGAGLLIGATMTMGEAAGQALAVVTVAALLWLGVALRRVLLIGIGAAGIFWVIPATVSRYLPGPVAAPLAVTIVGLVLLAIALWLARTRWTAKAGSQA
jgi:hypothetical protein